jgi:hypothetical protein
MQSADLPAAMSHAESLVLRILGGTVESRKGPGMTSQPPQTTPQGASVGRVSPHVPPGVPVPVQLGLFK